MQERTILSCSGGRSRRCFKETEAGWNKHRECSKLQRRSRRCFKETEAVVVRAEVSGSLGAAVAAVSRRLRRRAEYRNRNNQLQAAVAAVSRRLRRI